jgi:hypothetical protein
VSRTIRRFRHPHLSYGVAYTAFGAFQVHRGIIEAPEEVGTRCGWMLLGSDDDMESRPGTVNSEPPALGIRAH